MEVLCKATTRIINRRLTAAIMYHESLHVLLTVRGTGNVIPEAKLLHQLTTMRGAVFHAVFLGIQKAYNTLDRDQCLEILVGYCVGPPMLWLLWMYWTWLQMVTKSYGYFDTPLQR